MPPTWSIPVLAVLTLIAVAMIPSAEATPPVCRFVEVDEGPVYAHAWVTCYAGATVEVCVPGAKCVAADVGHPPDG